MELHKKDPIIVLHFWRVAAIIQVATYRSFCLPKPYWPYNIDISLIDFLKVSAYNKSNFCTLQAKLSCRAIVVLSSSISVICSQYFNYLNKLCFPLLQTVVLNFGTHFPLWMYLILLCKLLPQELGADEPEERNWKGIIIAVLVICFVIGMIITSVMLLTPPDLGPRIKGERMTLRQLLEGDFTIKDFNGTWISSGYLYKLTTAYVRFYRNE